MSKDVNKGKVWLVGAGPSDQELLTVKAVRLINEADVIVYDKLVGDGILSMIPTDVETINVGKVAGNHPVPQGEINEILLREAKKGKKVVRLKGGDPFVFGRGGEELELLVEHGIDFEIVPGITSALREAKKGKKVVRLKGGDPFVFGRGGEELELLVEHGIDFEIVPGITSAISVPAYNGIPVTHRDYISSFHVITGHTKSADEASVDYQSLVKLNGTLIFLMGIGSMAKICNGLMAAGMSKDMPAAVLEKGTTAHQRRVVLNGTLIFLMGIGSMAKICNGLMAAGMSKDMPAAVLEKGTTAHQRRVVSTVENLYDDSQKAEIKTPAIIIVGKVCSLADNFTWAEKRPLAGLKIAVTRPRDRSSKLANRLRSEGAEVVLMPAIKTEKISVELKDLKQYTWIGFTSPAGVDIFFEILKENKMDIRTLAGIKIAVIGSGTAKAVEKHGMLVDAMPTKYSGENMGKMLAELLNENDKILIARAKIGTSDVIKPLVDKGLSFDDLAIYDTIYEDKNHLATYDETIDLVTFTSASTVKSFVANNENIDFASVNALCIGEQTAAEAEKYNMKVYISEEATIASMVQYLLNNKEKFLK